MYALSGQSKLLGIATLVLSIGNPLGYAVRPLRNSPTAPETNIAQIELMWKVPDNLPSPYNCVVDDATPLITSKM